MRRQKNAICIKVFQAHYPAVDPNVSYSKEELHEMGIYFCSPNDIHPHVEIFREFGADAWLKCEKFDLYKLYKDFGFAHLPNCTLDSIGKYRLYDGVTIKYLDKQEMKAYILQDKEEICTFSLEEKFSIVDDGYVFGKLVESYDDLRHVSVQKENGIYYICTEQLQLIKRYFPHIKIPREDVYDVPSLCMYAKRLV